MSTPKKKKLLYELEKVHPRVHLDPSLSHPRSPDWFVKALSKELEEIKKELEEMKAAQADRELLEACAEEFLRLYLRHEDH